MPTIKKVIDIIHDLFKIGKTTAKDLQISGDRVMARRIKKAIASNDIEKLKKLFDRKGILIDGKDILEVLKHGETFGVLVSVDLLVQHIQMGKIIRRYKRREG